MFDIITKAEYWRWLDEELNGRIPGPEGQLKHIQDTFILSVVTGLEGKTILEFGGGNSRILKKLSAKNECWNVDRFEGQGGGPTKLMRMRNVKTVQAFMGEENKNIPAGHFDYVFSISVLEHIPGKDLDRVFADCARVMKPGGNFVQAIDLYLPDAEDKNKADRQYGRKMPSVYLKAAEKAGLKLKEEAGLDPQDAYFRGHHASNSDATLFMWNLVAPKLRPWREHGQSVSLKAWWVKPE